MYDIKQNGFKLDNNLKLYYKGDLKKIPNEGFTFYINNTIYTMKFTNNIPILYDYLTGKEILRHDKISSYVNKLYILKNVTNIVIHTKTSGSGKYQNTYMFNDLYSYQEILEFIYNYDIYYCVNPSLNLYFVISKDNTKIYKYYPRVVPLMYNNSLITKTRYATLSE